MSKEFYVTVTEVEGQVDLLPVHVCLFRCLNCGLLYGFREDEQEGDLETPVVCRICKKGEITGFACVPEREHENR